MESKRPENVIAGLVGAFLGSLIGVVCTVIIGQLGYVSAFSGLVMAVCTIKGYEKFSGSMSRKGAAIALIVTVIMTYMGNRCDFALSVCLAWDVHFFTAFQAIDALLDAGFLNANAYWGNLLMLYLFTVIGGVPTLMAAFHPGGTSEPEAAQLDTTDAEMVKTQHRTNINPELNDTGRERKRMSSHEVLGIFVPFGGMFLGFVILWLSFNPILLNQLVGKADTPKALLQGYRNWYGVLIAAVVFSALLPLACCIWAIKKKFLSSVRLTAICIAFPLLIGGAMLAIEDVPGLWMQSGEDLEQIDTGNLLEVTTWLSSKTESGKLPGPYTEGQPEPVTIYSGITADVGSNWVRYYIPNCLDFSPDKNALYRNSESVLWNEQYTQKYRLLVTKNFRLAVSVEPVENPTDWTEQQI